MPVIFQDIFDQPLWLPVDTSVDALCSLAPQASHVVAGAFFAAVANLLLGEASSERSAAWNDSRLADHLRHTYTAGGRSPGPAWLRVDPARQALAYAVADADSPLSRDEAADILRRHGVPGAADRTHEFTAGPASADCQRTSSAGGRALEKSATGRMGS